MALYRFAHTASDRPVGLMLLRACIEQLAFCSSAVWGQLSTNITTMGASIRFGLLHTTSR